MPRTIGGIVGFVVMATVTVIVGNYVYNRLVAPAISRFMSKAA